MSSAVKKAVYSTKGPIKMRCSSCLWGRVAVRKGDREIAVIPQGKSFGGLMFLLALKYCAEWR